ncbi:hypothetical protein SRHO_G00288530 [Serrasalmus rhombeus]
MVRGLAGGRRASNFSQITCRHPRATPLFQQSAPPLGSPGAARAVSRTCTFSCFGEPELGDACGRGLRKRQSDDNAVYVGRVHSNGLKGAIPKHSEAKNTALRLSRIPI